MFNKYYQDEVTYLRELGQEFAAAYPAIAPLLAERGGLRLDLRVEPRQQAQHPGRRHARTGRSARLAPWRPTRPSVRL